MAADVRSVRSPAVPPEGDGSSHAHSSLVSSWYLGDRGILCSIWNFTVSFIGNTLFFSDSLVPCVHSI